MLIPTRSTGTLPRVTGTAGDDLYFIFHATFRKGLQENIPLYRRTRGLSRRNLIEPRRLPRWRVSSEGDFNFKEARSVNKREETVKKRSEGVEGEQRRELGRVLVEWKRIYSSSFYGNHRVIDRPFQLAPPGKTRRSPLDGSCNSSSGSRTSS